MKIRLWLWVICLSTAAAAAGCSKQEIPPPPRTQPELLLEIYDAARRQQYNAALLKIQKMRALDPTSVFLAELENTIHFNRMTAVVNTYLQMGKFEEALNALQDYENKFGYSDATEKAKERLFFITRLDRQIRQIRQAKHSDDLEQEINQLKILTKNTGLSPKILNFVQKQESVLVELRKTEKELTLHELRCEAEDRIHAGDSRTGAVFAAVYAMEAPERAEQMLSVLTGTDEIEKPSIQELSN